MVAERPQRRSRTPLTPDAAKLLAIRGLFSDEQFLAELVLKGGNALFLVLRIGPRRSRDIDLSIRSDFSDPESALRRLEAAMRQVFTPEGYEPFDFRLEPRPGRGAASGDETWGGYDFTFKVIDLETGASDIERARREAVVVGSQQEKKVIIQISKFEFCGEPLDVDVNDQTVRVYSPALIAIEKLRAICQQLPSYSFRAHPAPRARDFFDIYNICNEASVRLRSDRNQRLVLECFAAKQVPVRLLSEIPTAREFHRSDWPSVETSVGGVLLQPFDFYYDFLVDQIQTFKVLRDK